MANHNQEDLVAYVKGECEEEMAHQISNDEIAQMECDKISQHLQMYQNLPRYQPSAELWQRLHEQVQRETPVSPILSKTSNNWKLYVAAASLLFLAIFIFLRSGPSTYSFKMTHGIALLEKSFPSEQQASLLQQDQPAIISGSWSQTFFQPIHIVTLKDTIASFELSEKISCSLGFASKLTLENSQQLALDQGKVFVEVTPGKPLTVTTTLGQYQVLGTSFEVEKKANQDTLSVYQGSVKVKTKTTAQTIPAGKGCSISSDGKVRSFTLKNQSPDWVQMPFSLTLDVVRHSQKAILQSTIKNLSSSPIAIRLFSGTTPHLLLHITKKDAPAEQSYSTPFFLLPSPEHQQNHSLPPGETLILKNHLAAFLDQPGEYEIHAVYQGKISTNNWNKAISSKHLHVTIDE